MNTEAIRRFFTELIFAGFLTRFVPGGLFYLGFSRIYSFRFNNVLIDFIFGVGIAWTLGLVIELLFSRHSDKREVPEGISHFNDKLPLFLKSFGAAIILGVTGGIIDVVIDNQFLDRTNEISEDSIQAIVLRGFLAAIIGAIILMKGFRMTGRKRTD
ncbi:MAG: hypothetical protein ACO1N0_16545 [Fluviicola sp.]